MTRLSRWHYCRNIAASLLLATLVGSVSAAPTRDDMLIAAKTGNAATIEEGIQAGIDPNTSDPQGYTLLIHAAANNNPEVVAVLLKHRANPALRNKVGDDALNYGAIKGNLPIVRMLIAAGMPPTRKQGWQPLTYAILGKNLDVFNYLMDQGADPEGLNPNQVSALMYAAQQGEEAMVDRLLKAGADPTWTRGNESAVDWALKAGNTRIAEKIMKAQSQVGFSRSSVLNTPEADSSEEATAGQ